MNTEGLLDELLALLENAGVAIRIEPMGGGGGGMYTVKGKNTVMLDSQASTTERAGVCARALVNVIDIEAVYMKPEVRQFVEREAQRSV
jgi:hypothetical protein